MLEALRFVQGAVARKDFVPELSHFRIAGGRITGFNGQMALSSPIDLDINAKPKAATFIKAVGACCDTVALNITKTGRLGVKSGKFKAYIECLPEENETTIVLPEGEDIDVGENFIAAIKALAPFQAIDASRPWAMGIRLFGQSMMATNNICLVEYWHGHHIPIEVNIPKQAITELVRINETPTRVQLTKNSITFHFSDNRWLRSQLLVNQWPENIQQMLDIESTPVIVQDDFFDSIQTLKPFLEDSGKIFFTEQGVKTSLEEESGMSMDMLHLPDGACFHHSQLMLLNGVSTEIDFSLYPKPCYFKAPNLRGVIMGMRHVQI